MNPDIISSIYIDQWGHQILEVCTLLRDFFAWVMFETISISGSIGSPGVYELYHALFLTLWLTYKNRWTLCL